MELFEIPDSDDEAEAGFVPSPRPTMGERAVEDPALTEYKSDAMRSGSTDPGFFQTVYEEHKEALLQVSRPAKSRSEKTAPVDDPYDIPSSPDVSVKKRKPSPRESKTSKAEGGQPLTSSTPGRKRRRLSEDADQVSLVKVPSPRDDAFWENVGPYIEYPASFDGDLPSTLDPLQGPSERPQLQPVATMDSSGFVPTQDQGPSAVGRGGLIKSSGSATNINTQRSLPPSMPLDNYTQEVAGDPKAADLAWVDSSPDLLAASNTPRQSRRGKDKPSRVTQMSPVIEHGQPEQLDALAPPPDLEPPGYASTEEPVAKKPAKGKKQRGRPRKKAVPELVPEPGLVAEDTDPPEVVSGTVENVAAEALEGDASIIEAPNEVSEEVPPQRPANPKPSSKKPQKKAKKKRGRPKKSEEAVPVPDAAQEAEPHVQEYQKSEPEPEPEPAKSPGDKNRDADAEATGFDSAVSVEKGKKENEDVTKTATKAAPVVQLKKTPTASNGNGPGSTPGNKPLYRVGLSKRSRIAPLLKIVRKD